MPCSKFPMWTRKESKFLNVLVLYDCHNKVLKVGGLKQQEFIIPLFWRIKNIEVTAFHVKVIGCLDLA